MRAPCLCFRCKYDLQIVFHCEETERGKTEKGEEKERERETGRKRQRQIDRETKRQMQIHASIDVYVIFIIHKSVLFYQFIVRL